MGFFFPIFFFLKIKKKKLEDIIFIISLLEILTKYKYLLLFQMELSVEENKFF